MRNDSPRGITVLPRYVEKEWGWGRAAVINYVRGHKDRPQIRKGSERMDGEIDVVEFSSIQDIESNLFHHKF